MGVQEARAPLEAAQFELCGFVRGPLRMAKRAQLIEAIEEESLAKATAFLADAPLSVTHDEMRAACWQGNLNIFNLLVEQGGNAYISAIDAATQRSLLHDAAQHGNSSVCKRLLELGVDPTLVSTQDGCTAAELAARNDWPATVAIFNNHVATAPVVPASTPTAAPTQPTSLEELLARLDLSKFAPTLAAEDIDLDMAYKLTEEEFAKLGLTIGARRKLYAALHPAGGSAAPAAGALSPPPVPAPAAKAPPPSPLPAKVSAVVVKSPLVRTPVTPTTAASKPVATAPPSPLVKAPAAAAPLKPPALAASKPPPAPLAKPPAPVVARAVTAPVTPPASPPAPASDSASASESASASTSTSASASAYTCAEGHAMAVETRFAFTCDKCGADGGQVVTRWRCAQCKFDMCHACAPLPPTEAGGGGSTEAPAPAPAPAGPLLFCSKAHPLAVLTSYKFVCDKCHRSGCDVTTRWQCAQCQYDLCHACAPLPPGVVAAPVATQPASASDFKLSCKEGHALVPSTHRGGFSCSRCEANSPAHSMSWRCQPCDYDICNKCSPLPDPGTVAALAPANLIAPGYHLTRCGAAGCRGFMGVAKKHGSCKVCKKEDPVPFGRFGSGLSSFDRPFGSTHSSAFGSNSSFGHSSSFGNNRMPLGSMHDPPRSSLTSSFASAAPEAPTAGVRLVCAQGCGNSICEKCDAATQPARVVCTYCLSVFSKEKLSFHHTSCHAYTCPYPDCGRKFHNWSDRQEHMWEKCAISYINAQVGKANDERAAPDDDDSPSYHSSSSSSSFSSSSSSHSSHSSHSRPAPAPKKCRRCDGTRVMNCRKCGGSGHDGMVKGVHKPCKTCGGGGKKSCDSC